jgi:hypothetical protein
MSSLFPFACMVGDLCKAETTTKGQEDRRELVDQMMGFTVVSGVALNRQFPTCRISPGRTEALFSTYIDIPTIDSPTVQHVMSASASYDFGWRRSVRNHQRTYADDGMRILPFHP